jgi:hypothetical protein
VVPRISTGDRRTKEEQMHGIVRKVMTAVTLLVVGGLVIGGAMAFAGDSPTPSATISSPQVSVSDDGTADQGPGDVPAELGDDDGTEDQGTGDVPAEPSDDDAVGDDDGTPDQGPGDVPAADDDHDGDDDGDDDNSGPSENSGPGSTDDSSGHGEDD